MSCRHKVQDATGVVITADADVVYHIISNTTPTNGQSGFGVGCKWINKAGTVGSIEYTNVGTATSATWLNIA